MRRFSWLLLLSACSGTELLEVPPLNGAGTFVFVSPDEDPVASVGSFNAEGLGQAQVETGLSEGLLAARFDCLPEDLALNGVNVEVDVRASTAEFHPDASFILREGAWVQLSETESQALGNRLSWNVPELCDVRRGTLNTNNIAVPARFMTGMIPWGDQALLTFLDGNNVLVDRTGNTTAFMTTPRLNIASLYRAGDGFFALHQVGTTTASEIFRVERDGRATRVSDGPFLDLDPRTLNGVYGSYRANRLTGDPSGQVFAVSQARRFHIRDRDEVWRVVSAPGTTAANHILWDEGDSFVGMDFRDGREKYLFTITTSADDRRNVDGITPFLIGRIDSEIYIATEQTTYIWGQLPLQLDFTSDSILLPFTNIIPQLLYGLPREDNLTPLLGLRFDDGADVCHKNLRDPGEQRFLPVDAVQIPGAVVHVIRDESGTERFISVDTQMSPMNQCGRPK